MTFLADLTVALVAASVLGALARLVRVTPILGYVIAGIAISPLTPGYHATAGSLSGLSELGLILLLFSLGLGFSLRDLRSVGLVPMIGNLVLMSAFGAVAWALAASFGLPHPITLAFAFTLSSTAIGVALLQIFGLLATRPGHAAIALLIAQDLVAILILVVTSTPAQALSPLGIAFPLIKAAFFVVIALILGATLLHRVVAGFLRRAPPDALIAFCTAVALIAAWLGHLAGLSFEFGAFVAGAVISEAAGSRMIASIVTPFRELFVMIFFVSIGTLVDLQTLGVHWQVICAIGIALALLRFGGWLGLGRLAGQPWGTAVALGIALVPLGEFNIVLAQNSYLARRLDAAEFSVAIGATLISIVLAAIATRALAPYRQRLDRRTAQPPAPFENDPEVLIVGYGRVGRTAGAVCRRASIRFATIETDVDLVARAHRDGVPAAYGDGADPSVLEGLLTTSTRVVLSTIPDTAVNAAIARRLRARGSVRIVVRAARVRDIVTLRAAGASDALVPEAEGAFGFATAVLEELGIARDRIDRYVHEQRAAIAP